MERESKLGCHVANRVSELLVIRIRVGGHRESLVVLLAGASRRIGRRGDRNSSSEQRPSHLSALLRERARQHLLRDENLFPRITFIPASCRTSGSGSSCTTTVVGVGAGGDSSWFGQRHHPTWVRREDEGGVV
jgi:hypothetical protein